MTDVTPLHSGVSQPAQQHTGQTSKFSCSLLAVQIYFPSLSFSVFTVIKRVSHMSYDTKGYDSMYLTCSKKLTGSQLSPPHGTNKKLKFETKNKTMSMIGPVQSRCHEGSPV